ncbi:UbiH/UbiF family hydroxylase [Roseovarius sp. EL26]|uniref:UbiH/UbiF family hydroxylase n=1 Tax=Roseovarius sp. EL26 TaxID=2126672 RepID=UPI000EA1FC2D|nr:UbiH/UbiF family hydroxylase [Roseovarius sp. EL26]
MTDTQCDILIAGGGVAGLTAAILFGNAGFSVICVDPTAPVTTRNAQGSDLRTTAFLQPAQQTLAAAGLWNRLAPFAADLQIMRIVDAGGADPEPRVIKEFNASDISDQPFGWNLPNWLLRREMLNHIDGLNNVDFRPGVGVSTLFTRTSEARVTLTDNTRVRCRLAIAADGRNSTLRQAARIDVKTTRYGQKALAFTVTHPMPHEQVSTEIHRSGGPFTLVPLPDYERQPCSAIVWMEDGGEVQRLAALPEADFEAAMNERSCLLYGPLKLVSRRTVWPIISQQAESLYGERLALLAEAAHVVPPIGAQGLNMSLADMRALLDLAQAATDRLGDAQMLEEYHRQRHTDIATRVAGIDLLNRASQIRAQPLRDLRAAGLNAIYGMAPVRKALMQMGLGMRG